MDLKLKHITWVGNIYQKFEAVCQEVDDIVGQDAVKYLGNQVHNVGDSVKKLYSGVVQELLPLSPLVSSAKHGAHSMTLKNNVGSSFKSISDVIDTNEKGAELKPVADVIDTYEKGADENPANNFIKSLQDSNAIDPSSDWQVHSSIKHDLVNQVSDETSSNSLEVEDSSITQEEIDDDDSRETFRAIKENLHMSIEQNAVESTPQLLNLISFKEKEPLEFSVLRESLSSSSDSGCGILAGTKNNSDVSVEQTSYLIVEENATRSSTSQVLNFMSLGEKELFADSLFSEPSAVVDEDTCGKPAEVSPSTSIAIMKSQSSSKSGIVIDNITDGDQCLSNGNGSESSDTLASSKVTYLNVSCERPMMKMEPLCFERSLISDSLCSKSPGSCSFEIESNKTNSVDAAGCIPNSSMVLVSCGPTDQIMTSQHGLVSSGSGQSMESNEGETFRGNEVMSLNNSSGIRHGQICSAQDRAIISLSDLDESLVNSIESSMEDIQLSDDAKLEESCVFVDDRELYAVSCRAQRLRSYKKRIRDAFASKKRIAKEYEQLAIWYGDTDMEPSQGTSRTLLPFSSKRSLDSKNLQVQQECETEWELL